MKTIITISNPTLSLSKKIEGEFFAAMNELNNVISQHAPADIERSELIVNGETLPLNITPFHYCFAKGRIDEIEVIEYLRTLKV